MRREPLLHLLSQPLGCIVREKCLPNYLVHDFQLTPVRMLFADSLHSDVTIDFADFKGQQEPLLGCE